MSILNISDKSSQISSKVLVLGFLVLHQIRCMPFLLGSEFWMENGLSNIGYKKN